MEEADDENQFTDIINAPISEEAEGDDDAMFETFTVDDELAGHEKSDKGSWLKADTFNSSTISLFNLAISEEYNEIDDYISEEANEVDDSGGTLSNEETKGDDGTTVDTILTYDSNFSLGRTDVNDNAKANVPKNEQVVSMDNSVETKNRENDSDAKELNLESKEIVTALIKSSLERLEELLKVPCTEDTNRKPTLAEKRSLVKRKKQSMTGWTYKQEAESMVKSMIASSASKLEKEVYQSDESNWKHRPVDT